MKGLYDLLSFYIISIVSFQVLIRVGDLLDILICSLTRRLNANVGNVKGESSTSVEEPSGGVLEEDEDAVQLNMFSDEFDKRIDEMVKGFDDDYSLSRRYEELNNSILTEYDEREEWDTHTDAGTEIITEEYEKRIEDRLKG